MKIDFPFTIELLKLNDIFNQNSEDNLRIVGGAVRDFIINKNINDFDLSSKLSPEENIELLKKNHIKFFLTGVKFGTITAIINNKTFEITSTRKDLKTDGRHAEVSFTNDFKVDAGRRDFTFNALYLDFKGNVYDYFNGIEDLKDGIVKFIGNPEERIKEDYLRILRFFRFYCYYGKNINEEGLKYSIKYIYKLKELSGERIKIEMYKILKSNSPINTLKLMYENNILQAITDINNFKFDNIDLLFLIKKYINIEISAELILSLLLNDKDDLNQIEKKWKLSKKENSAIYNLLKHKNDNLYSKSNIKTLLFEESQKTFLNELIIMNSIINLDSNDVNIENIAEYINKEINDIKKIDIPKFPINGEDLKQNGFTNYKNYSKILIEAKNIFINSNFLLSKEELMEQIKKSI